MRINDNVEVFNAFAGTWTAGFRVARVVDGGYRLRRTSDGSILPTVTGEADLRIASAEHSTPSS